MKKIYGLILTLMFLSTNAFATTGVWDKTAPATSSNAADIGVNVATANNEALDRLVGGYRRDCTVVPNTSSAAAVLAGEAAIPNSDASVVRWQKNASTLPITSANIDVGGAFSNSTYYYVYLVGDSSTTFTVSVSTSSSAPSGKTYYLKVGYLYIDSSGNITSVGNLGSNGKNFVSLVGTTDISFTGTTSPTLMTGTSLRLVASGHQVRARFTAPIQALAMQNGGLWIYLDGSDVTGKTNFLMDSSSIGSPVSIEYVGTPAAGTHTFEVYWAPDNAAYTLYQYGSTGGKRVFTVEEL